MTRFQSTRDQLWRVASACSAKKKKKAAARIRTADLLITKTLGVVPAVEHSGFSWTAAASSGTEWTRTGTLETPGAEAKAGQLEDDPTRPLGQHTSRIPESLLAETSGRAEDAV